VQRRHFLKTAAAALVGASRAAGQVVPVCRQPVPRVNGGINVQPLRRLERSPPPGVPPIEPELIDLQMRAVYALGFEQMRITLPFNRFDANFLAAIPYVRAARALGIDVVGVMSDFAGYALVQAIARNRSRAAVLNTYRDIFVLPAIEPASPCIPRAGELALQVLNEPTHSLGITPAEYVPEFLRPVKEFFALRSPELPIVSAAEVGSVEGILRVRALLEAGLEAHCDRVGVHVYSRRLLPFLSGLFRRTAWVTESGPAARRRSSRGFATSSRRSAAASATWSASSTTSCSRAIPAASG
jgi:hypothetical protein